jgi:hypothetical protein
VFALRRAGFLARYRFALDFIERAERDPAMGVLFDEAHPALGLPDRSYARLQLHYLNVARATGSAAVEPLHRTRRSSVPEPLAAGADEDAKRILVLGRGTGPKLTAVNAVKVVSDAAFSAWLPAQERIARWAGDVRVHRHGEALISEEQMCALRRRRGTASGTAGRDLPLATVGGRLMLTPNEIARRFAQAPAEDHRLGFVAMLDGSERTDRAHAVSEQAFAASWRRPKWHIVVAAPPESASR